MQKLDGKWLVAISAGSDSMALLSMCVENHMDVMCAHVNYHHRKEAEEEQAYVMQLCQSYHVPLCVKDDAFTYTGNFEAEAREYRYDFFVECVKRYHLKGVLVAHHEDDVLETYFMQEEKGSIPSYYGLKEDVMYQGILVKRPLLKYTKQDLIHYCEAHQIRYYVDCTNADESLTRNRIRHQIVEKMNRFERDLVLKEIQMKNATKQERVCRVKTYIRDQKVSKELYRTLSEEDRLELLRMFFAFQPSISLAYLKEIDHVILTKEDFVLPCKEYDLACDQSFFFFVEKDRSYCDVYHSVEEMTHGKHAFYEIAEGRCGVYAVTLFEDDFPIQIRNVQDGDTIAMRFGNKNVHRFFVDRHIPLYSRTSWPVIENRYHNVIFVSGLGCDVHHYTVNPTCNVLEYTLLKEQ